MVDCTEFLESYSDLRDGRLAAERVDGFEAHLQVCDSCARYDRVIGGGVQVFRSLPTLAPSPDFQVRLLGKLYAAESVSGRHGSGASLAVTLMICAVMGLGAWIPALRPVSGEPVVLPPIVAHAPYHDLTPVLMQAPPPPLGGVMLTGVRHSSYYNRNLLLEQQGLPHTTLAYRPASYYGQR